MKREKEARERVIVALDVANRDLCLRLLDQLEGEVRQVKVGPVLFGTEGLPLLREISRRKLGLFLDLKFHDIPNTVSGAVKNLCQAIPLSFLTLHAGGGRKMIEAARAVVDELPPDRRPNLLAVTVLTSLDDEQLREMGWGGEDLSGHVANLARLAWDAGAHGVVSSPHEVVTLRKVLPPEALVVVPGIRPSAAKADDQKRTSSPGEAYRLGASYLVVGRPITASPDPRQAFVEICQELRD